MNKKFSLVLILCIVVCAMATGVMADHPNSGPVHHDSLLWPVFKIGMHQPEVKSLQFLLRAHGYHVVMDGKFGKQTQDAVKRYQRAHKFKVDGVVAAYTWESLVMTLRKGSHGDAVRAVQLALKHIPVDGVFGKVTEDAVKVFQKNTAAGDVDTVNGVVTKVEWCYLLGGMFDWED